MVRIDLECFLEGTYGPVKFSLIKIKCAQLSKGFCVFIVFSEGKKEIALCLFKFILPHLLFSQSKVLLVVMHLLKSFKPTFCLMSPFRICFFGNSYLISLFG